MIKIRLPCNHMAETEPITDIVKCSECNTYHTMRQIGLYLRRQIRKHES